MEICDFEIDGVFEIIPRKIEDERGYFSEIFKQNVFAERVPGIEFVQDNQSLSVKPGTIRGIHFQTHPAAQGKLVRCLAGRLLDVAVDLRHGSPTFGRWISAELFPARNNQLWVPVGFGHAFCSLEPNTVISYRVTSYYSPENDKGVAWDDPDIAVVWPEIADPATLSGKDSQQPRLADLPAYFSMEFN
jgi:dTDP-4-dehydrorhamnose 3,5-epimerase